MDTDLFLTLLNVGKDLLEDERPWQFLRTLNSSNTATSSAITLPANFKYENKIWLGADLPLTPVPFEELHRTGGSARYCIDRASNLLYVLGGSTGQTLYIYYIKNSDEITLVTSPVFPSRFHKILGFYVVGLYQSGVDADDIFARMSVENKIQVEAIKRSMINWDSMLQNISRGDSLHYTNAEVSGVDLSQM